MRRVWARAPSGVGVSTSLSNVAPSPLPLLAFLDEAAPVPCFTLSRAKLLIQRAKLLIQSCC